MYNALKHLGVWHGQWEFFVFLALMFLMFLWRANIWT